MGEGKPKSPQQQNVQWEFQPPVVTMDIAARTSTGRSFPDGAPCEVGNVLVVNVEDGVDDTIVPRLKAHGADLERVYIFSSVPTADGGTRLLEIPADIPLLENKIIQREASLLIIDPVLTMLGGDANKDQDARKALAPLRDLAERTRVAVIAVRHLKKSVGLKAIQRGGGNMGLIGVARAGSFFAPHPDDESLRVMAAHKSNLAQRPPSLSYRIVSSSVHNTARIEWTGTTAHDADSLAAGNVSPHEKSVLDEAKEFLREELTGGPVWAKQVYKDARDAGIAEITLRRAKTALGVRSERQGTEGWAWRLPDRDDQQPPDGGGSRGRGNHQNAVRDDQHHGYDQDDQDDHVDHLRNIREGVSENPPYLMEDDQGDQGDQGDREGHDPDHLGDHLATSTPHGLTAEEVAGELRRSGSGPALALANYLDKPNPQRLEYLTQAVLNVRGLGHAAWEDFAGVVKAAATDPQNHPLDCECAECVL